MGDHWCGIVDGPTELGRGRVLDLEVKASVLCGGAQRHLYTNTHICWKDRERAGHNSSVPSPDQGDRPSLHYNRLYENWGWTGAWNYGKSQCVGRLEVHSCQLGWSAGMQTDIVWANHRATPDTASCCKMQTSVQSCYPQIGFHSSPQGEESLVKLLHNLSVASLNLWCDHGPFQMENQGWITCANHTR